MTDFSAARRHMVDGQLRTTKVTSPVLLDAMSELPREQFVPTASRGIAYIDEDLPIGSGRFLLDPLTLARLIQAAEPASTDTVLDVGCGTGYSSVVLARLAGSVAALEEEAGLAGEAEGLLKRLAVANVTVAIGPLAEGLPKRAPFNVILINGAVDQVPDRLVAQLAEGGRLAAVVGTGPVGRATLITKRRGVASTQILFDASAPPLKSFTREAGFVF